MLFSDIVKTLEKTDKTLARSFVSRVKSQVVTSDYPAAVIDFYEGVVSEMLEKAETSTVITFKDPLASEDFAFCAQIASVIYDLQNPAITIDEDDIITETFEVEAITDDDIIETVEGILC